MVMWSISQLTLTMGIRRYKYNVWRQDYISLVNPSLSCLHKSRVRARAYTVGQKCEGDLADMKIHCIFSHLLFCDREGPRRLSLVFLIPKTFKASSLLHHYQIQYLNTMCMPHDSIKSFVMIEQSEEVFCRTMRILICGDRDIKNK